MKPSRNHQYGIKDLRLDNIVVFLIKNQEETYLTDGDVNSHTGVGRMYQEMIDNVLQLRHIVFSKLKLARLDYAKQTEISMNWVDIATACAILYGLNTGMVVRYLKGKYIGESTNAINILEKVSPYISDVNCEHIKCIINQGWPSHINFKRTMIVSIWSFKKGTNKPSFSSQKSRQNPWIKRRRTAMSYPLDHG